MTLSLVVPCVQRYEAWLEAHAEWGPGLHEDGFGLRATDDVSLPAGFAVWVARLLENPQCTFRWIVQGDLVLGGIALRHKLSWDLGHVGYGVRPSARGRGVATWALGRMLEEARAVGLERILLVCDAGNLGSARTIEHNGGVLEADGDVRRYWIEL